MLEVEDRTHQTQNQASERRVHPRRVTSPSLFPRANPIPPAGPSLAQTPTEATPDPITKPTPGKPQPFPEDETEPEGKSQEQP
jgi:hypothetical protein